MELLKLAMCLAAISSAAADGFIYLESARASFSYVSEPRDSDYQQLYCESHGASLWVPQSAQEVTNVLDLFKREDFFYVWLGINEYPGDNMKGLMGVNGQDYFHTNWAGQNTSHTEVAVKMDKHGQYVTEHAPSHNPAICSRTDKNPFFPDDWKGYTHIPKFEASYKYYEYFSSFLSLSNIKCRRDGARLWVPESAEEVAHIFNTIVPGKFNEINVGIYNEFQSGFITIDGRENYYSNWADGYPIDYNDNTIVLRNGSYLSDSLSNKAFVCKRTKKPTDIVVETSGYSYNTQMDKLFKVHLNKKNFNEAGKVCESEKGSLLMVDNIDSLEGVFWTVKRHMKSLWLGYHKLGREQYIFVNGEVAKMPERDWSRQGCGFLSENYKFSSTACDSEYPFICQINGNKLYFEPSPMKKIWYMFVPYGMTWYEAARFCNSRNSSIVTFEADREPTALIQTFPKMNVTFVGYFKTANIKQMVSLKGFDTSIISQIEWEAPPVTEGYCVGMTKNKQLLALDCNQPQPFICKKLK